jgi:hypothetical protein
VSVTDESKIPDNDAVFAELHRVPGRTAPGRRRHDPELVFQAIGLVPEERNAKIVEASVTWNYTTVLNIIFLGLAAVLVWRFVRTGGLPMLRMMHKPMGKHA